MAKYWLDNMLPHSEHIHTHTHARAQSFTHTHTHTYTQILTQSYCWNGMLVINNIKPITLRY